MHIYPKKKKNELKKINKNERMLMNYNIQFYLLLQVYCKK